MAWGKSLVSLLVKRVCVCVCVCVCVRERETDGSSLGVEAGCEGSTGLWAVEKASSHHGGSSKALSAGLTLCQ